MKAAEHLNLDPEIVGAHAAVYYVYALDQRWRSDAKLTVTTRIDYLTIAASYFAVVDPLRAIKCFRHAAEDAFGFAMTQREQQKNDSLISNAWLGRAAILRVCANEVSNLDHQTYNLELEGANPTPSWVAAELIVTVNILLRNRESQGHLGYLHSLLQWAAKLEGHVVGKMGIPIVFYRRLADFALKAVYAPALESWLKEISDRIDQQVRLAQTAEDHCKNLHSGLLPIEPETLSAVITFIRVSGVREMVAERLVSFPPAVQAYLEVAMAIDNDDAATDARTE